MSYQIHKRGSSGNLPAELTLKTCLAFHRTELVRQRDQLRDVGRWYLLPFVPGFTLILLARAMEVAWTRWGTVLVFFVVIFGSIAKLNQRAARRIQREIETLDNES